MDDCTKLIVYSIAFFVTLSMSIFSLAQLIRIAAIFKKTNVWNEKEKKDLRLIFGNIGMPKEIIFTNITISIGSTIAPFIIGYEILNILNRLGIF